MLKKCVYAKKKELEKIQSAIYYVYEEDGLDDGSVCHVPVSLGSDSVFRYMEKPLESEDAIAIVREAMRDDATLLYIIPPCKQ